MSKVSQAHDKIFKNVFADRKNALNLLDNLLPADILNRLKLKEMVYEKDTLIQKHLKGYYSDLLISIPLLGSDQRVKVYFLFEHKSYSDPDLPLQLLRYIIEIWTHYRKQHKHGKLPLIIPLVITHAEDRWKKARLKDIVDMPDESFKVYLPDFDYLLFDCIQEDLNSYNLEVELKSLLMLWKYSHRPNFLEAVRDIYRMLLQAYPGMETKDFLIAIAIAQYLYFTRSKDEYGAITEIVKQETSGGINMETIADMLREEGKQHGVILGKQEGLIEGELKAMQETLIDLTAELYGPLPGMLPVKIKSIQSMENLRTLTRKIIKTESLDEFTELVNRATDN